LAREVVVDRLSMNAEDTADTHRIQSAAVNQAPDRFRMDAELIRNLANADERMVSVSRRHRRPRTFARSSITRIHQGTSDRLERPDAGRASLRTTRRRATALPPRAISAKATSKARADSL
jgi:hypothetical protein